MSGPAFIHLRVHSTYSPLEGAIRFGELMELCARHAMPAVAVTDTNNLYGAMEFAVAASKAGVQPIIGCQMDVDCGGGAAAAVDAPRDRLVLLVQSEAGYRNLMVLSSRAFLDNEQGDVHTTLGMLEAHSEGLICLSGGPDGPLGRLLGAGRGEEAAELCRRLAGAFEGRLYIELQRHGLAFEDRVERGLVELAYAMDIPLVATNDAYFTTPDMHRAHDVLLAIAEGRNVNDGNRRKVTRHHHLRSAEEMRELFSDIPEAVANTVVVARRCAYMPPRREPILPPFGDEGDGDEATQLREQARRGLEGRLERHVLDGGAGAAGGEAAARPYRERLDYELSVIGEMGFPGYFLIVADFVRWARENGIPVGPGRGSGAGSVVAWALGITDLDPLRFGLLFERFLNPERVSMPDFDIDFCQDRRDEVIRYVRGRYGEDRVANIITFGTLQARATLRDVGRVLGMPYGQVDKICKLVPNNPASPTTLQEAIDGEPQLRQMRASDESVAELFDISLRLEGLHRHASTHAAGVIIADRPLTELVPLYRDPRALQPATQFSMKHAEAAGLVKFDFLGLKTLTVIDTACGLLAERGVQVDPAAVPLDDPGTFGMLGRGETTGVFQLESAGMRDALRQMRPDSFEDIIALVSLYRPGPMDNIPQYIARKHGREEPDYLHPDLRPVLEETFGVIIYQEQVMEIARILAGYSLGGADLLRRAMGKKIPAEMAEQRQVFVDGAVARGVEEGRAQGIFNLVDKFAGYGFNKSHGAAYALVAYQTAWLKAHHPVEFLAASMTLDYGDTDKLAVFRHELDRLGIGLLPPDINRSEPLFSVERGDGGGLAVRYALAAVKNVGVHAMREMVDERRRNGPYRTVTEFASRLGEACANRRQLESLVRAGAFDGLEANRRRLNDSIDSVTRFALSEQAERSSGQPNLFGEDGGGGGGGFELRLADVDDWPGMERLAVEFEAVGCYLSAHPLDGFGPQLERLGVTSVRDARGEPAGARLQLAGTVIKCQERRSEKAGRFAFVRISDPSDTCEVMVGSELLADVRELLETGRQVHLEVRLGGDGDEKRLFASSAEPLERLLARDRGVMNLVVDCPSSFGEIKRVADGAPTGPSRLGLIVRTGNDFEVEIRLPYGVSLSPSLRSEVMNVAGVCGVVDG